MKYAGLSPREGHSVDERNTFCTVRRWNLHSLISIRTGARPLVVFGAVNIWAVIEGPVPSADGPAAPLVQEVPVETRERPVLCAFVLYEQGALLGSEFLQISGREREATRERVGDICGQCHCHSHLHKHDSYVFTVQSIEVSSRAPLYVLPLTQTALCCCHETFPSKWSFITLLNYITLM